MAFEFDSSTARADDDGSFDPSTAVEVATPASITDPPSALRRLPDIGVSALKGAIGVPEAALGIANIVTGGHAGRLAETAGFRPKEAKAMLDEWYSPQQKAANLEVEQAKGFFPTVGAALSNPSTIAQAGIESIPLMLGGGVVARGLLKGLPKLGGAAAAGIGEGVTGAGIAAEQIRQQTDDGLLTPSQAGLAAGVGALTGAIGAGSGKLAQRLGITDVDTVLAGRAAGAAPQQAGKGRLRQIGEGALVEGVLEELPQSMQEQAGQNLALDRPIGEGVPEAGAMGMLVGGAMGGGINALHGGPSTAAPAPATPAPGDTIRDMQTPDAGPLTRAVNAGLEAEAQTADAGANADAPIASAMLGITPPADGEKPNQGHAPIDEKTAGKINEAPTRTRNLPGTIGFDEARGGQSIVDPFTGQDVYPSDPSYETVRQAKGGANAAVNAGVPHSLPAEPGYAPATDAGPNAGGNAGPALIEPETLARPGTAIPGARDADAVLDRMHKQGAGDLKAQRVWDRNDDGAQVQAGDIVDGERPFKNKLQALRARAKQDNAAELDTVPVAGGYALRARPLASDQGLEAELPNLEATSKTAAPPHPADAPEAIAAQPDERASMGPMGSSMGSMGTNEAIASAVIPSTSETPDAATLEAPADVQAAVQPLPAGARDAAPLGAADSAAAQAPGEAVAEGAEARSAIDQAAHSAATSPLNDLREPSDAEKEQGNYAKGHVRLDGMQVSIENPKGSIRRSKADAAEPWQVTMPAHYGYIRGTVGADTTDAAKPEHVDLTIGDAGENHRYWVINQQHPDGSGIDEHKVFTGVASADEAVGLYKASFTGGFGDKVFHSVSGEMTPDELKAALPGMRKPEAVTGGAQAEAPGAAPATLPQAPSHTMGEVGGLTAPEDHGAWWTRATAAERGAALMDAGWTGVNGKPSLNAQAVAAKPWAQLREMQRQRIAAGRDKRSAAVQPSAPLQAGAAAPVAGDKVMVQGGPHNGTVRTLLGPDGMGGFKVSDTGSGSINVLHVSAMPDNAAKEPASTLPSAEGKVSPAATAGEFVITVPRSDGGVHNLAGFKIGANGKPTNLKHFFMATDTRAQAQRIFDRWKVEQGAKTGPAPVNKLAEAKAAKDAQDPVRQFGDAMRAAGLELDGLDVRSWVGRVGERGEIHATMREGRGDQPTVYDVRSFSGGKETGDSHTGIKAADLPAEIARMRADLEREGTPPKVNKVAEAKAAKAERARADYFTPGNIIAGYGGQHDRVVAYTAPTAADPRWSVQVQHVVPSKGGWVTNPNDDRIRNHATEPTARELARGPVVRAPVAPSPESQQAEPDGLVVMPASEEAFATAMKHVGVEASEADDDEFGAFDQARGEDERMAATFRPDTKPVSLPRTSSANPVPAGVEFMAPDEAAQRLQSWKDEAARQGREMASQNAQRTVISLFDASGVLSQPWVDAGYNVVSYDLQTGADINTFDAQNLIEQHGNDEVWAILAQPPCTDFASSGAQWWKAKDADGRTEASNELVRQTLRTVELFRPPVWVMENPVGRISRLNELPEPLLSFDPWHYGDPYTKRTLLWGRFDPNLPTAMVEPVDGSKIHRMSSSAKYERSLTPEGFAYAMFMANNAAAMPEGVRLSQEFAGIDAKLFNAALAAGHSVQDVRDAIEDAYYDSDLGWVRDELARLAKNAKAEPVEPKANKVAEPKAAKDAAASPVQNAEPAQNTDKAKETSDDATPEINAPALDHALAGGSTPAAPVRGARQPRQRAGRPDDPGVRGQGGLFDGGNGPGGNDGNASGDADVPHGLAAGVGAGARRLPAHPDFRPGLGGLTRTGSWLETAERNVDLIELALKIQADNRAATPAEQAQLSKYVGFGASAIRNPLFPVPGQHNRQQEPKRLIWPQLIHEPRWRAIAERLDALPREWQESVLQSTQYAHYTSEGIVRSVWSALQRIGFTGGKVLEPGSGIGNFSMLMPDEVHQTSKFTGIEFDGPTALISRLLSPEQNMLHDDFIKRRLPKDFYDLAVGNPPFAQTAILGDPDYLKHRFALHDFFFAKAMDRVRPGGLLAFVTSKGTMDKQTDKARKFLADRADLLGAIRLPSTAFEANAGTSVVTDVIFLRKRMPGEAPGGVAWNSLSTVQTKDGPVLVNEYFAANPQMVLGQQRISGNTDDMGRRINSNGFGGEKYTVVSYDSTPAELDAKFAAAVERLPQNAYAPLSASPEQIKKETAKIDYDPLTKREGVVYVDQAGALMRVESGVGRELAAGVKLSSKDHAWFKGYVGVRDLVKQAQAAQINNGPWQAALKALNKAYDAFVKEHGPFRAYRTQTRKSTDEDGNPTEVETRIYTNTRLLREDYDRSIVTALEEIDQDGKINKSKFLTMRTVGAPVVRDVKTIGDALAVSLDAIGKLNLADVASRLGISRDEAIESLGNQVYQTPAGEWQLADEYLSGDVVTKLAEAIDAAHVDARLARNVEALKEAQPEKLGPSQIGARLGASWIPAAHINDFAKEIGAGAVTFSPTTESWQVGGGNDRSGRMAGAEYGTARRSASELLEHALNSRTPEVKYPASAGKELAGKTDAAATTAAVEMVARIKARFKSWVWTDSGRAAELVEKYNNAFNNIAPRKFDGSHLTLPGVSTLFKLHPHQLRAIWRQIVTGNTYLAHAVGAGKTIEMIAGGMEQKRLGLISKPLYAVPNQMLEQFAAEFMELYPLANIMVADDESFSAERRKAFIAAATLNKPDAIIITHSAFERIGVKEESVAPIRDQILGQLQDDLDDAAKDHNARVRRSQLEAQIEAVKQRFDSIVGAGQKDSTFKFEDMGVDFVYADEAHNFRKLDFPTNQKVKGIDPNGSRRTLDMFVKTRYLESLRPGRSFTFASGTPVTNTMGELYTLMRFYIDAQMTREGIASFDGWARQFGDVATFLESNAAGRYETVTRFAKFENVPELMSRVRQFMDVLRSDQLGAVVKRPDIEGGKPDLVVVPMLPALRTYMDTVLGPRLEVSKRWKPSPQERSNPDPVIAIITDGRFAALDPRFFGATVGDNAPTKLNRMADGIIAEYKATSANPYTDKDGKALPKGGTQIVFYNLGFGESAKVNRGFDSRAALTRRLVAGGIKREHIAWFDDANTDAKKGAMFRAMRTGQIRVMIGSAKKMGTGVNVQDRLTALHYFDAPWYPADVEQPHGRIIRQGNKNATGRIFWYATKGTYDSTMWQMVARKQRFIDQAFSGDKSLRTMEDLGEASQYEQAAAVASGDPRAIQLAGLRQDVERLERLQAAHASEQISVMTALRDAQWGVTHFTKEQQRAAAAFKAIGGRHFMFTTGQVGRHSFDKQTEFGQALKDAFNKQAQATPTPKAVVIGTLEPGISVQTRSLFDPKGEPVGTTHLEVEIGGSTYRLSSSIEAMGVDQDALGLTRVIVNQANRIGAELTEAQRGIERNEIDVVRLNKKLGAPFEHQQEMLEKYAELRQLEADLAAEGQQTAAPPADAANPTGAPNEPDVLSTRTELGATRSLHGRVLFAGKEDFDAGSASPLQALRDVQKVLGINLAVRVRAEDRPDLDRVPMRYELDTKTILYNRAVKRSRAEDVQYMLEEVLHAADHLGGKRTLSASNPRFLPGGDIRTEIEQAIVKSAAMKDMFRYPLLEEGYSDTQIAAELFARLGVLYHGNPALFKLTAPTTHSAYEQAFGVPGSPTAVRGQVRQLPETDSELVRGGLAAETRVQPGGGRGTGAGNDGRDPLGHTDGLQRIRKNAQRALGGRREGAPVTFGAGRPDNLGSRSAGGNQSTRRAFIVGTAAALADPARAGTTLGRAQPVAATVLASKVSPAVEKLLRGDGHPTNIQGAQALTSALDEIATNGPVELRALAAQIVKMLPARGLLLSVDDTREVNAHGAVRLRPVPHLTLFTAGGRTGLTYGTLLHEALHAAVAARYASLSTGLIRRNDALLNLSAPQAAAAMAQFRAVWDEFKMMAAPDRSADNMLSVREAINDPDEFFVRALTDPVFQQYLAGKTYEGKTLWERFKDWVKTSLFGFKREGTAASWLDAALAASGDLTSAMLKDNADWARLSATNKSLADRNDAKLSAADATGTAAFKQWFGDSKVVDKDGAPLVVYHGTVVRDSARAPGMGDIKAFDRMFTTKFRRPSLDTVGSWFSTNPGEGGAGMYAGNHDGSAVYPVYLSIKNPQVTTFQLMTRRARLLHNGKDDGRVLGAEEVAAYRKWLADMGKDGIKIESSGNDGSTEFDNQVAWVALEPEQIKSAIGNSGAFDANDPDIRFSKLDDLRNTLRDVATVRGMNERVNDLFSTQKAFNGWWHKTVGTQYHKAQVNPEFKVVYDNAQDYQHDINAFANDSAGYASQVLPQLNGFGDVLRRIRLKEADSRALAEPLFAGTLTDQREYDAAELAGRFKLTPHQITLYQQTRAAIGRSLDTLVASDVARFLGPDMPKPIKSMISAGDLGRFKGLVTSMLQSQLEAADAALKAVRKAHKEEMAGFNARQLAESQARKPGMSLAHEQRSIAERAALTEGHAADLAAAQAERDRWATMRSVVAGKYDKVDQLKNEGYAPLMRFGRYSVYVTREDAGGEVEQVYFGLYETEREANRAARGFRAEAGVTVTQGVMSQEAHKLFAGLDPETVALFADLAGIEKTDVMQDYLKLAVANRSALKRLIHRKGVAGFSEDPTRVLASFLTSNARAASGNLHLGEMDAAINDMQSRRVDGSTIDEAMKLREYVKTPREEAQAIRGLLFVSYIGGSIASAMVNLTQPLTMTFPYLAQYGGAAKAGARLTAAIKQSLHKVGGELGQALVQAEKEGIISPQEIHQLQAEATRSVGNAEIVRKGLFVWGSLFSLAEQFNRRSSFIAAWHTAKGEGIADAYAFATNAVEATQGVYNKGNRPNWARGPVGATLLTFKQFTISYLEFLKRLPNKERALALAVLFLAAGAGGMPGADDLDDLIDTLAQGLGSDFNSEMARTRMLTRVLGAGGADFVLHGVSAALPFDVSGRLSVGNLVPGTGLLLKSKPDKSREVLEVLGAAGSMANDLVSLPGSGDWRKLAPTAIRNLDKSIEMYQTGQYKDERHRNTIAVDGVDAAFKAIGFQPATVAADSRKIRMAQQQVELARVTEGEIAAKWAQGVKDKDPEMVRSAVTRMMQWNRDNPQSRIAITPAQIQQRVRQMGLSREQRFIKSTPKEMRGSVLQ